MMIMLTEEESIKVVKLFFQLFYSTSNDVVNLMNALPNTNNIYQQSNIVWRKYLDIANTKLTAKEQFPTEGREDGKIISEEQAFEAMYALLIDIYKQTNSNDIGSFLGDLLHGNYGSTSDPAAWEDWQKSIQQVISERQTTDEISAN